MDRLYRYHFQYPSLASWLHVACAGEALGDKTTSAVKRSRFARHTATLIQNLIRKQESSAITRRWRCGCAAASLVWVQSCAASSDMRFWTFGMLNPPMRSCSRTHGAFVRKQTPSELATEDKIECRPLRQSNQRATFCRGLLGACFSGTSRSAKPDHQPMRHT